MAGFILVGPRLLPSSLCQALIVQRNRKHCLPRLGSALFICGGSCVARHPHPAFRAGWSGHACFLLTGTKKPALSGRASCPDVIVNAGKMQRGRARK